MICIATYGSRRGIDGRAYVRAEIQADTIQDPMPRTGEGIDGLDDFAAIDIGSRLSVLDSSAVYVLGEDWTWYRWTEQSGGGGGEPGVTPNIQMTAGVTPGRDGDPEVDITRSGSDENPRFHAQFRNIEGLPGENGQSAEIEVSDAEGGHTVTVRSAAGEESFFVKDGADGEDGGPGPSGESPTVEVSDDDGGHTVTIRYAGGTESFFVPNGRDGAPGETPSVSVSEADGGHDVRIGSEEFFIPDGKDGTDGETPDISVEPAEGGHNVRIGAASFFVPDGRNGVDGVSPTLEIGTVTTGEPGTAAKASIDPLGGGRYAVSMRIPKGADGTDGKDGSDPRLIIGSVDTLPAGSQATADIEDVGQGDFILDLGIPKGDTGQKGDSGADRVLSNITITKKSSGAYGLDLKYTGYTEGAYFGNNITIFSGGPRSDGLKAGSVAVCKFWPYVSTQYMMTTIDDLLLISADERLFDVSIRYGDAVSDDEYETISLTSKEAGYGVTFSILGHWLATNIPTSNKDTTVCIPVLPRTIVFSVPPEANGKKVLWAHVEKASYLDMYVRALRSLSQTKSSTYPITVEYDESRFYLDKFMYNFNYIVPTYK